MEECIIGIDLGTTNSCVAVWNKNQLEIISDEHGHTSIPSAVAFTSKSRYIGREAQRQRTLNPRNVFYEFKRLIGRKFNDPSVVDECELLSYELTHDENNNVLVQSDFKTHTPEELSALILSKLKHMAIKHTKKEITKAVITIPAYFNDAQRQATKDAATIAGLECVRMINEPTAAALAYGTHYRSVDEEINAIVYDFGGGTLDVSLLNIHEGVYQVLASSGNTQLGGSSFDEALIRYCMIQFSKQHNLIIDELDPLILSQLKRSCELAKKSLSTKYTVDIAIPQFYQDRDFNITITRDILNKVCSDLLILSLKPIEDVLESCNLKTNQINEIILVGGMTKMPAIRDNIEQYFNKKPNTSVDPNKVVVAGAAIQAFMLSHRTDPFTESITLLDVIPLSLGVETFGRVMSTIIPRNTPIPVTRSRHYSTDTDYAESVTIRVYEGERQMVDDNFFVGEFELTDIEKRPRGVPDLFIQFKVDLNGIITVTAEDKTTHSTNEIVITGNKGRLTCDQIKQLVEQAKQYELEDTIEKEIRQVKYEIKLFIQTIRINLQSEPNVSTLEYVAEIENRIDQCTLDQLVQIKNEIEMKYLNLIRVNEECSVKPMNNCKHTLLFDDEDSDDEDTTQSIDREVIKQLRKQLMKLCQQVCTHETDDIMLWIHVCERPTIAEYKYRIELVEQLLQQQKTTHAKKELDDLLNALQNGIDENQFPLNDSQIQQLVDMINKYKNTTDYTQAIQNINYLCYSFFVINEGELNGTIIQSSELP